MELNLYLHTKLHDFSMQMLVYFEGSDGVKNDSRELEAYLGETLHVPAHLEPWLGARSLPAYLRGQYEFFEGTLNDTHILFLKSDQEPAPSVAMKHERAVHASWDQPVAFAFNRISPRNRQRMIQEGLAFVVPGSQVYLPYLGATLRERYRTRSQDLDVLRPSAQLLLLSVLSRRMPASTPTGFSHHLGYSAMAMGQAVDQLESSGLVDTRKAGHERLVSLASDPADIWARAQPLLRSPVRRRRYLSTAPSHVPDAMVCGLSALASYSMLAESTVPAVALSALRAKGLFESLPSCELHTANDAGYEVEVWTYSPLLLSDGPAVDRLSLYLSLRGDEDERVQSALDEMMRGIRW